MTDSQKLNELRKVFDLFRRGILTETEAVRHVIAELPINHVKTVLAEIPERLLNLLKTFLFCAPKTDDDWNHFKVFIIDGDDDAQARLRRRFKANTEVLRSHFGMKSSR